MRVGEATARAVRDSLEPRRDEMIDLLRRLVEMESPSDDEAALIRFADALEELFGPLGSFSRHGSHCRLRVDGATDERALVLCHFDTVWPAGTLQQIPFSVDGAGVARGPGVFDMKGGLVVLYYALTSLRQRGQQLGRPVTILFTSDEETGSLTSRALIEAEAQAAVVAYVLESALPGGALKTARKGTGDYLLTIQGRAAHAGVEPQKGVNAIQELAHQTLALHALNDYAAGTTVNVGVVRGGTRPNVVPAEAVAEVDVRVSTLAEADRLDGAIRALQPRLPGAVLHIEGGLNRPPMERSPAMGQLFERAQRIAAAMGVPDLGEGSTGGGSDGNFTAALGVPTLDGLGPEGEGPHAAHENVLVDSLPRRAALIAGLLADDGHGSGAGLGLGKNPS